MIPPPVDTDFFTPGRRRAAATTTSSSPPSPPTSGSTSSWTPTAARAAPAAHRGHGPGGRAACGRGAAARPSSSGGVGRRDAARPLSRLPGRAHAGGRGLRDRAPRGHGLRPARRWFSPRGAGRRRSCPARRASSSTKPPPRPCAPPLTPWRQRFNTTHSSSPGRSTRPPGVRGRFRAFVERAPWPGGARPQVSARMVKFQTRMMAAVFVLVDVVATALAWLLAYFLRFHSDSCELLPVTKGVPELSRYLLLLPLIARALADGPLFPRPLPGEAGPQPHRRVLRHPLQRAHRLRPHPGRDPLRARLLPLPARGGAALGVQPGGVRVLLRARRAAAQPGPLGPAPATSSGCGRPGYNVKRVLVAGAGELGQIVAETLQAHRELGYRVVGFVDDTPPGRTERAGLPVLGTPGRRHGGGRGAQRRPGLRRPAARGARASWWGSSRPCATSAWTSRSCPTSCSTPPSRPPSRTSTASPSSASTRSRSRAGTAWSSASWTWWWARPALLFLTFVFPFFPVIALLIKLEGRPGAGLPAPGAHDPRRQHVPDLQVPHHGGRGGEGDGPGLRHLRRPAADPGRRSGCAATTSTSCPSS